MVQQTQSTTFPWITSILHYIGGAKPEIQKEYDPPLSSHSSQIVVEVDARNVNKFAVVNSIAKSPYWTQSSATPPLTRDALQLTPTLPVAVEPLALQKRRAFQLLRSKTSQLEKYIFLAWLRNTNTRLFYSMVLYGLEEIAPIIYTPTVGTACLEYHRIQPFLAPPGVPDGLYLTLASRPHLHALIRAYHPYPLYPPSICVITDGSRILGLGDLGVNGLGIPIGKLQLYVAGAGIDPRRCLPIVVDLGTDNEKLRGDEMYLGVRHKRPGEDVFYSFVDDVLNALTEVYPDMLIQFEDWSSEHAFSLLAHYQNSLFCFNDDIQGTGAVILAGVINALRIVRESPVGLHPTQHRLVFFGAGSAGVGVAKQLVDFFVLEYNMPEEQAAALFWVVDTRGLITLDRGDKLAAHKVYFARKDNKGQQYRTLEDVIEFVKPTVLIGLSTQRGTFTPSILRRMAELNDNPVIFPLSNPADNAECTFEEAMIHTDHRAIFASGTGFPSYIVPGTGEVKIPGQGNNMYIFPGLGLGATLARPPTISNAMIYTTARSLANALTPAERAQGLLYPHLTRIREVSAQVAAAVCLEAVRTGVARNEEIVKIVKGAGVLTDGENAEGWKDLVRYVRGKMWEPEDGYGSDITIRERN